MTNEQKAHDIAVAMLPKIFEIEINKQSSDNNVVGVDIFEIYQNLYDSALKAFDEKSN